MISLDQLKCELALNKNNYHVGSKLGGNYVEYFHAITHIFEFKSFKEEYEFLFSTGANNTILVNTSESNFNNNLSIEHVRKEFSNFVSKATGVCDCTEEDLGNNDFYEKYLEDNRFSLKITGDFLYLKNSIESANSFLKSIKRVDGLYNNINENRDEEINKAYSALNFNVDAINNRYDVMEQNLFSDDDLLFLQKICASPIYIASFTMRAKITLECIINYSLDKFPLIQKICQEIDGIF